MNKIGESRKKLRASVKIFVRFCCALFCCNCSIIVCGFGWYHYCDVIMGAMASQITSLAIVYSSVHSGIDKRKHQSSTTPAFVLGIQRWPVNSSHKWPVTRKMFPFEDVSVIYRYSPGAHFTSEFFHHNPNSMENSFCSCSSCTELIAMKLWTWHDS